MNCSGPIFSSSVNKTCLFFPHYSLLISFFALSFRLIFLFLSQNLDWFRVFTKHLLFLLFFQLAAFQRLCRELMLYRSSNLFVALFWKLLAWKTHCDVVLKSQNYPSIFLMSTARASIAVEDIPRRFGSDSKFASVCNVLIICFLSLYFIFLNFFV